MGNYNALMGQKWDVCLHKEGLFWILKIKKMVMFRCWKHLEIQLEKRHGVPERLMGEEAGSRY